MTSVFSSTPAAPASGISLLVRTGAAAGVAAALVLLAPTAADAHVRVRPDNTTTGSYSALTFRVPNESSTAGTVKVAVQLPQDTPFLSVSTKPVPGWTATATEAKLPKPVESEGTTITKAVRTVTWRADKGNQIGPGQYQEFSISVGPLPQPGTVLLPAQQTYSDGKVVSWDEPTPASGDEPEHPAPALEVTAAADPTSGTPSVASDPATSAAARPPTAAAAAGFADSTARALGGAALFVAAIGVVVAAVGLRRSARSGGSA